jgi:hypothetical protein
MAYNPESMRRSVVRLRESMEAARCFAPFQGAIIGLIHNLDEIEPNTIMTGPQAVRTAFCLGQISAQARALALKADTAPVLKELARDWGGTANTLMVALQGIVSVR